MPDDQNVPFGRAGQTHSARVKFASDTVREKVGDLLVEAGGTLATVNEGERRRVARRLRKAKGDLLPLLRDRSAGHALALSNMRTVRVAVNRAYGDLDTPVSAGDEVAFFPPVTGG